MAYQIKLENSVRKQHLEKDFLHNSFHGSEADPDSAPEGVNEDVGYYWEEDFDFDVGVGD